MYHKLWNKEGKLFFSRRLSFHIGSWSWNEFLKTQNIWFLQITHLHLLSSFTMIITILRQCFSFSICDVAKMLMILLYFHLLSSFTMLITILKHSFFFPILWCNWNGDDLVLWQHLHLLSLFTMLITIRK